MAVFEYQALTPSGRLMKGTVEAPDPSRASEVLAEMKLTVQSVAQAPSTPRRSPIGRNEFLLFNQQLASITKAGIPLEQGLRQVAADVQTRRVRRLVSALADDLQAGMGVEEAFRRREGSFPPLYGQIVKAGICTGRLSEMLTSLNRHLEIGSQTCRIIFDATAYPLVVLAMAAVLLTAVVRFVIPSFEPIFADMGEHLPSLTRWLMVAADHVFFFWLVVAAAVGALMLTVMLLRTHPQGRRFKESVYLRVPVLGRVYHRSLMARLTDAMAMLIEAGLDMPACLRLAAGATGSETLKQQCEQVAQRIEQGSNFVEAGQGCAVVPQLFFYSVQLGYQRNELTDNLRSLSEMYTQQARTNQTRLQAMLLPVMLIVVGGIIGTTITAMFLPMVSFISNLSK